MRLLFFASLSLQIELKLQLNRDSFQRGIEFLVLFSMITVVTFLLFVFFFVSPLFAVSNSFTQLRFFKIHILQCQLVQSISCLICVAFLSISLSQKRNKSPSTWEFYSLLLLLVDSFREACAHNLLKLK